MAQLRRVATEAGLQDVATYIQSGNLIFASSQSEEAIASGLTSALEASFGFSIPVTLRDRASFSAIAVAHPFEQDETDDRYLAVAFLDHAPTTLPEEVLPEIELAPDRYTSTGRELYIHYPGGSARSKLGTDLIDRRLGVVSTVRNWRTVRRLATMTDS